MKNEDDKDSQEAQAASSEGATDVMQLPTHHHGGAARPYRYSRKSWVAWLFLMFVLGSLLPVSLLTHKDHVELVIVIYMSSVFLFFMILFVPQLVRQLKERKRLGQPLSRYSTRSHIAVYSFDALYFILYFSLNGPARSTHLLNTVYGAVGINSFGFIATITQPLLTIVAPMAIVYYIFLGPQIYKQMKERKKMPRTTLREQNAE